MSRFAGGFHPLKVDPMVSVHRCPFFSRRVAFFLEWTLSMEICWVCDWIYLDDRVCDWHDGMHPFGPEVE